jgi:hypothetical protein
MGTASDVARARPEKANGRKGHQMVATLEMVVKETQSTDIQDRNLSTAVSEEAAFSA